MLRVGEVEQASVERLNNCINIAGSPRTHAYTAEGGRGVGGCTVKLPSHTLSALIFFLRLSIQCDLSGFLRVLEMLGNT